MIVFALVSASDRKKKAAKQAEQHRAGMGVAAGKAVAAARSASQMSISERQARMAELKQKQAERAAQKAARAAGPVTPGNARASFESSLNELKELLEVAVQPSSGEGDSMLADADCVGGSMPHDHAEGGSALEDEECAGGSMEHHHTQGVSRAAQSRRLEELDSRREAEHDAPKGLFPKAMDAAAMRRAVVMAEVLGKPRARQVRR